MAWWGNQEETMKISFDYDDTLEREHLQALANSIKDQHELWIVTTRYENPEDYKTSSKNLHKPIFEAAEQLSIPKERIVFTNMKYKADTLKKHGIQIHFDDNEHERRAIISKNYPISFIDVLAGGDLHIRLNEEIRKWELLEVYQLKFKAGYVVEDRENMSHWKVCKIYQFSARTFMWLFFRYHKLCNAKLNYFSQHQEDYMFKEQGITQSTTTNYISAKTTKFLNISSGKSVDLLTLRQCRSVDMFEELIEWLES